MKQTIALLADVHGNIEALKSVLRDFENTKPDEVWFLGDLLLPGPGHQDLFELLSSVNTTTYLLGNWEQVFLENISGLINFDNPTDIYGNNLVEYIYDKLPEETLHFMESWPLCVEKEINGQKIRICHHLPHKTDGREIQESSPIEIFDEHLQDGVDITIFAHIHKQVLRYGKEGQLIINPGSVGQPYNRYEKFQNDYRAQYATLSISSDGLVDVKFHKIEYDRNLLLDSALKSHHPYYDLYETLIMTGNASTHNKVLLSKIQQQKNYRSKSQHFMARFQR